jgi:MFS transporter, ACS family, aldohexuronate transporter
VPANHSRVIRGLRWWIIGLIFLATLINFVDRLTVSILGPVIIEQLRLTNSQFGSITTWFLVAYTASQGLSGKLYDRVGAKQGFTISVLVWSVAASAHAFARGLADLRALRVVLGLGEAGNWPGAAKVIAEWFPIRERAFAMGIFNSGVAIGNIVAFPLVTWLQLRFGWKTTFLVTGALGFGWLLLWRSLYEAPDRHRALTTQEYRLIKEGRGPAAAQPIPWRRLLEYRQTWSIVLARFLTDPVWWLYITWLPVYLYSVRGFNLKEIGLFGWLPFVTADAGSLLGGYVSGRLIARGWSVNRARKFVIAAAAVFMVAGIPAALTVDRMVALACIACVTFGFQAWINNVQTIPSDVFPTEAVASVAGLGGVGAGIGAILFTMTTGYVVDRFSYTPILLTAALLPIVGTAVLFTVGGTIRPAPAAIHAEPRAVGSLP